MSDERSPSDTAPGLRSFPALARIRNPLVRAVVARWTDDPSLPSLLRQIVAERRDALLALVAAALNAWSADEDPSFASTFSRARSARVVARFVHAHSPTNAPPPDSFLPLDRALDALLLATSPGAAQDPTAALRRALALAGDGAGGAMLPLVVARIELGAKCDDASALAYGPWIQRHGIAEDQRWLTARGLQPGTLSPEDADTALQAIEALRTHRFDRALDLLRAEQGSPDRPVAVCRLYALAFLTLAAGAPAAHALEIWGELRLASHQLPGPLGDALETTTALHLADIAGAHPSLRPRALSLLPPDDRSLIELLLGTTLCGAASPSPPASDDELTLLLWAPPLDRTRAPHVALAYTRELVRGPVDAPLAPEQLPDPAIWATLVAETRPNGSLSLAADVAAWRARTLTASLGRHDDDLAERLDAEGASHHAAVLWLGSLFTLANHAPDHPHLPTLAERIVAATDGEPAFYAAVLRALFSSDRIAAAAALLEVHPLRDPGPGARETVARIVRTLAQGDAASLRRFLSLALDLDLHPRDWRRAWSDSPSSRTRLLLELDRLAASRDDRAHALLTAISDERRALLEALAESLRPDDVDALLAWHLERTGLARFESEVVTLAASMPDRAAAALLAMTAERLLPEDDADPERLVQCERLAAASLQRQSRQSSAHLTRADCAIRRGRYDDAVPAFEAAGRYEQNPARRASIYLRFGDVLRDHQGHLQAATEQYLVAFMCEPANADVVQRLEAIYEAEGRYRELAGLYEITLEHHREHATDRRAFHQALLRYAQIEFEFLGHPERAVALLQEAVRAYPESARPIRLLRGPLSAHVSEPVLDELTALHDAAKLVAGRDRI